MASVPVAYDVYRVSYIGAKRRTLKFPIINTLSTVRHARLIDGHACGSRNPVDTRVG
jgi:hypothetical protein